MMRRVAFATIFLLVGLAVPGLKAQCTISWTNLVFGNYTGTLLNGTNTGTINCPGQSWNIPLDAGTGAGATTTIRKMTGPGGLELSYQLFQDAAHTKNWGNTSGVDEVTGSGSGQVTVYGQIIAGQYPTPGTYTDTISSATRTFTVTATVQAACTLSATSLAFGTYSGVLLNSTSALSVTCTNSTTYNVGLNAGTASGATVTNRSMKGPGSALLGYKMFRNSGRTLNWGNTVGSDTVARTGSGSVQGLTVYGQIPAGQFASPPGNYSDTITATITY